MVAHRTLKNEPHARTSHTLFRKDFARTRATAHRTCVCAHAPSQLIPWKLIRIRVILVMLICRILSSLPDVEISKPKTGNDLRQHRKKINEDRSVKKPLIIEDTKCYSSSALDLNSFDSMSTTVTSTTMEFKQLKL